MVPLAEQALDFADALRDLIAGRGLDEEIVDGHQADGLRGVGLLDVRERKDRGPWQFG